MFKFINKKKICAFWLAAASLVVLAASTAFNAFACPYVEEYRVGSAGCGVYQRKGDVPLDVKNLKLTFDISDFPDVYGSDLNYRSKVTGEYTVFNPTDETVTAQLIVPEMDKPNYFGSEYSVQPQVKINGEAVQTTARQLSTDGYRGCSPIEVPDEWYSDGFFKPDLPVHTYKITAAANLTFAYLKGDIITDFTKARYIADGYTEFSCQYTGDGDNLFYILGDDTAADFSALSFYNYDRYELVKISDLFAVNKVETTTLKDFVLKTNRPADGVSDLDWYNGMLSQFSNNECVCTKFDLKVNRLNKFYTYSVEIAPHGELVTSVTLPVLPDVYSSNECRYEFLMPFTSSWGGFGTVEVEILTEYNISYYSADFKQTETGFKAVYNVAPEGEIHFTLNTRNGNNTNNYEEPDDVIDVLMAVIFIIFPLIKFVIFFIGGGIAFIVLMVKKSKRN